MANKKITQKFKIHKNLYYSENKEILLEKNKQFYQTETTQHLCIGNQIPNKINDENSKEIFKYLYDQRNQTIGTYLINFQHETINNSKFQIKYNDETGSLLYKYNKSYLMFDKFYNMIEQHVDNQEDLKRLRAIDKAHCQFTDNLLSIEELELLINEANNEGIIKCL